MRKIYLLFTQFPTIRAKLMGKMTGYPYIHASLGLDENMNVFYSFRHKGYFVEQATKYIKPDREPFPCQLYEFEVEDKVYDEIKTILRYFEEYNFLLKYTHFGVVMNLLHIPYKRRYRYFCSHFVADVLKYSKAVKLEKSSSLYLPHKLKDLDGMNLVFQGNMQGYLNRYLEKIPC